jgi:hypothetical protein
MGIQTLDLMEPPQRPKPLPLEPTPKTFLNSVTTAPYSRKFYKLTVHHQEISLETVMDLLLLLLSRKF